MSFYEGNVINTVYSFLLAGMSRMCKFEDLMECNDNGVTVTGNRDHNTQGYTQWDSKRRVNYPAIRVGPNEYGTLTITVKIGMYAGSKTAQMKIYKINSITLNQSSCTIGSGSLQLSLSVSGYGPNGNTVTPEELRMRFRMTAYASGFSLSDSGLLTIPSTYKDGQVTNNILQIEAYSADDTCSHPGTGFQSTKCLTKFNLPIKFAQVSSVSVFPNGSQVTAGSTQTFRASVSGTGSYSSGVTWSIVSSGHNSGTTINSSGLLTVSINETIGRSITVRATSTFDSTKYGQATITVKSPITGVSVSPNIVSVMRGKTQSFYATVTGTGSVSKTVTWRISSSGHNSGTTVNSSTGLLTISPQETVDSTITVRATSTFDSTKYAEATVTVLIDKGINSVVISPKTLDIYKGLKGQFETIVDSFGTGPDTTVTYKILTTGLSPGTTINSTTGEITVAQDEPNNGLTIQVVSNMDSTKTDTATVNVLKQVIHNIYCRPEEVSKYKGETQQFTHEIEVSGVIDESVTWSVEGSVDNNSTIDNNGLLTIGEDESAESLTVKATSVFDVTKVASSDIEVLTPFVNEIVIDGPELPLTMYTGEDMDFDISLVSGGPNTDGITWEIMNEGSTSTITMKEDNNSFTIHIAEDEIYTQLLIRGTSNYNNDVVYNVYITIGESHIVDVDINPKEDLTYKGGTVQFTADVTKHGAIDDGVTWSIEKQGKIFYNPTALNGLNLPANEVIESLTCDEKTGKMIIVTKVLKNS